MIINTFSAFKKTDDAYIPLQEILAVIPDNPYLWNILCFWGAGILPDDQHIGEFGDMVDSHPVGYVVSWPELLRLTENLWQVYDCLIVGGETLEDITGDRLNYNDFLNSYAFIDIFDSTDISVGFKDATLFNKLYETIDIDS